MSVNQTSEELWKEMTVTGTHGDRNGVKKGKRANVFPDNRIAFSIEEAATIEISEVPSRDD